METNMFENLQDTYQNCSQCTFCQLQIENKFSCECQKAHYCSQKCLFLDFQKQHSQKCDSTEVNHSVCEIQNFFEEISSTETDCYARAGKFGLQNLHSTCYMNAGIQCLINIPHLRNYLLGQDTNNLFRAQQQIGQDQMHEQIMSKSKQQGKNEVNNFLAKHLTLLFDQLWNRQPANLNSEKHDQAVNPQQFKLALSHILPQFKANDEQHDLHEFLVQFLDKLHSEDFSRENSFDNSTQLSLSELTLKLDKLSLQNCISTMKVESAYHEFFMQQKGNSIISDLFSGMVRENLQCLKCKTKRSKYEKFTTLEISIPYNDFLVIYFVSKDCQVYQKFFSLNLQSLDQTLQQYFMAQGYDLFDKYTLTLVDLQSSRIVDFLTKEHEVNKVKNYTDMSGRKVYAYESQYRDEQVVNIPIAVKIQDQNGQVFQSLPQMLTVKSINTLMYIYQQVYDMFINQVASDAQRQYLKTNFPQEWWDNTHNFQQIFKCFFSLKVQSVFTNGNNESIYCKYCSNQSCSNCNLPFSNNIMINIFKQQFQQMYPDQIFQLELTIVPGYIEKDMNDVWQQLYKYTSAEEQPSLADFSLSDCLSEFKKQEIIPELYCQTCDCQAQCTKQTDFAQDRYLPPYLMILLKRSSLSGKIRNKVKCEDVIKLNDTSNESYKLISQVYHQGNSFDSGHYYSLCKTTDFVLQKKKQKTVSKSKYLNDKVKELKEDYRWIKTPKEQWMFYNDSQVQKIDTSTFQNWQFQVPNAGELYLCVYQRESVKDLSCDKLKRFQEIQNLEEWICQPTDQNGTQRNAPGQLPRKKTLYS